MSASWTRDDYLNQAADKIVIGNVDYDIDCKYELIELHAEDIMKDLIIPNSCCRKMKDGTTRHIDNRKLSHFK